MGWTEADLIRRNQSLVDGGTPVDAETSQMLEAEIERQCTAILKADGWRPLRTDPVSDRKRGKGFGELGMADHLYIRYLKNAEIHIPRDGGRTRIVLKEPGAEVLWIEFKRPGEHPAPHQVAWHMAERARGALTLVAGQDFPADFDGFVAWYRNSGLLRREGL